MVTSCNRTANKIRAIRTHGVENVKDPEEWPMPGFNFRFNDVLASIGIEQLKRLPQRISHLCDIYTIYERRMHSSMFNIIPVDLNDGEVPVYNEFLVDNRQEWIEQLLVDGVETRPFYPNLNTASYLSNDTNIYLNSEKFDKKGIYLPSGPDLLLSDVERVVNIIKTMSQSA